MDSEMSLDHKDGLDDSMGNFDNYDEQKSRDLNVSRPDWLMYNPNNDSKLYDTKTNTQVSSINNQIKKIVDSRKVSTVSF